MVSSALTLTTMSAGNGRPAAGFPVVGFTSRDRRAVVSARAVSGSWFGAMEGLGGVGVCFGPSSWRRDDLSDTTD